MKTPAQPQPDPAIGRAAENNIALGREALEFSKQQYEDGKPRQAELDALVDQVVASHLETQGKSSDAADDYLSYMRGTFRPVEQSLAADAQAFDTEAKREELAAQAGADLEQATGRADAEARREAFRYGVNPADGAFADNLAGSAVNKTAAKVGVMNQARTAARAEGRAFKFDVAGLGRGLPGAGSNASQVALQAGNAAAGTATVPAQNARAEQAGMTAGYGTAMSGNSSAAAMHQGLYNSQMQSYNAAQAASASTWGGIGQIAGTAAGLYMASSKTLKNRHGAASGSAALAGIKKTSVERWKYKQANAPDDRAEHVGPMAEDMKKNLGVGDGKAIPLGDAIGVTMAAVKEIAKDVDKLKAAQKGVKHGH